jgi:hypothetical protein
MAFSQDLRGFTCIASPTSHLRVCSIGSGQDMLVEHLAKTGEGNGPRITSSCQYSSMVSGREARMFRMPRLPRADVSWLRASGGVALQLSFHFMLFVS